MTLRKYLRISFVLIFFTGILISCEQGQWSEKKSGRVYYVSSTGDDNQEGSIDSPFKSIAKLNTLDLNAGDTVYFAAGQSFSGTLQLDSGDSGDVDKPVVVSSYGQGKATIDAGNFAAVVISFAKHVAVKNLHLLGTGRKEGNTQSGLIIQNRSRFITVEGVEVEGFQKSGALVYASSDVVLENIHAHNNGAAGISVGGNNKKSDSRDIIIRGCLAENNPGDPTVLDNHSGNGIIVGLCTNVVIEHCVATNNGWDMPRVGNGPVGIWTYESDSVVIQHCISYRNKTSKGGEDGGGFDLDGGVTNAVIQYCLSYENQGAGFGIFQYAGASAWKNNTVRFNISENDGEVSRAHSGLFVWNGSDDGNQFTDFYCYNNVVYNAKGNAIYFDEHSARQRFFYYNNIFVANDLLTRGTSLNDTFAGNNWWSLTSGFNMNGEKSFTAWAEKSGQEKLNNVLRGANVDPGFSTSANPITDTSLLSAYTRYKVAEASSLRTQGIDLKGELTIETGGKDFNQNTLPAKGIGASF